MIAKNIPGRRNFRVLLVVFVSTDVLPRNVSFDTGSVTTGEKKTKTPKYKSILI